MNREQTIFSQVLIGMARTLYRNDEFGVELSRTAYAFDSTTIDLCLPILQALSNSSCTIPEEMCGNQLELFMH
jgi:hypothetical protein